jgi:hypothetical protein
MEALTKPGLLAAYPGWYQLLLVIWLLITAILVGGYLLLRPEQRVIADEASNASQTDQTGSLKLSAPATKLSEIGNSPSTNVSRISETSTASSPPNQTSALRPLSAVENGVPLSRMPRGTFGYVGFISDRVNVKSERQDWYVKVITENDGSRWVVGFVSHESKAKLEQWLLNLKAPELEFLLFTVSWEQGNQEVRVPHAKISSAELFDFQKHGRRFEIVLTHKARSP